MRPDRAESYLRSKSGLALRPGRVKFKRLLGRTLVWVPSAIAAIVLLFFPVATHLACPGSRYLRHYKIPIPWTATVFSFRNVAFRGDLVEALVSLGHKRTFGLTPVWNAERAFSSVMMFSSPPEMDMSYYRRRYDSQATRNDFRLGDRTLICWQCAPTPHNFSWMPLLAGRVWTIGCATSPGAGTRNLYAEFVGYESDIPLFYEVIHGTKPLD